MSENEQTRRASLEYLKKLAKKRVAELRETNPDAKLSDAQLLVAREAGFQSWRQLKAALDQRDALEASPFFESCAAGDVEQVRKLLAIDSRLANAINPKADRPGWSALHTAVRHSHAAVVELLLNHGAYTSVREGWANATPLHYAANNGDIAIARALLDAGADVQGIGDANNLDVIGWATQFHPHRNEDTTRAVVNLLVERGAVHHIYSAISLGDAAVVREVLERDANALSRKSISEGVTPLSWAVGLRKLDIADLLIAHGADLEELNENKRTVLTEAILRGDIQAVQHLRAAGAIELKRPTVREVLAQHPDLVASVYKAVPMIGVPDIPETMDWYTSLGFTEVGRYWENNELRWGTLSFGGARLMLSTMKAQRLPELGVKLWFYTSRIDDVHELVLARQLEVAHDILAGNRDRRAAIVFVREINDTPYGSREFAIRDLNGYVLYFIQYAPSTVASSTT